MKKSIDFIILSFVVLIFTVLIYSQNVRTRRSVERPFEIPNVSSGEYFTMVKSTYPINTSLLAARNCTTYFQTPVPQIPANQGGGIFENATLFIHFNLYQYIDN